MNQQKVKQLLQKEEGFKLDFKLKLMIEQDSDKRELVKDVIAMANTPGGRGYILYGIQDHTKKIVGIEQIPENVEERLQQIIGQRSRPPVVVRWDTVVINRKVVGVLTIYKSTQMPHQMLGVGAFYVRRGSTTDVATRHEIATMLQNCGLVSFETVPCHRAEMADLDWDMVKRYLGGCETITSCIPTLNALGMCEWDEYRKEVHPTYGGLLVFGNKPQDFLPHTRLELKTEQGGQVFLGNIGMQLQTFYQDIVGILPLGYPVEALLEVVANALIHRDYWNDHYHTRVEVTAHEVIVSNPSAQVFEGGEALSTRTNSWLYTRLLLLHRQAEVARFGIGLDGAKQAFGGSDRVRIAYDCYNQLFKVYLPLEVNPLESSNHKEVEG
ncbi:MAG: AlbA family DNA-binding domain-containing protein [Cellulosilyticaceae bacterium]